MKTFVSVTQQMLDGELTVDEAADEIMQLEPAVEHYDYDGLTYEGNQENTVSAMRALCMDKHTGKANTEVRKRINDLVYTIVEKELQQSRGA